jgi:hypothetical protein
MTEQRTHRAYLGDGVYASFDGYQVWLAANHHENDVVALEPAVMAALALYAKRVFCVNSFREGDLVRYIPGHAHGDVEHDDCENGVVTSTRDDIVFVRYGEKVSSQATSASDLRLITRAGLPTPPAQGDSDARR